MHVFKHPKYYKELRKLRNKLDPVISLSPSDGWVERALDPGPKPQAPSVKLSNQPSEAPSNKLHAQSAKLQASSRKLQAP